MIIGRTLFLFNNLQDKSCLFTEVSQSGFWQVVLYFSYGRVNSSNKDVNLKSSALMLPFGSSQQCICLCLSIMKIFWNTHTSQNCLPFVIKKRFQQGKKKMLQISHSAQMKRCKNISYWQYYLLRIIIINDKKELRFIDQRCIKFCSTCLKLEHPLTN